MAFGLQCFNTSGELTLSADGLTPGYLGKATFVGSAPYSGNASSSSIGQSTWTFSSPNPIICALGLKSSSTAGGRILRVSQSGSTWTIIVQDLSNATEGPSGGGSFFSQRTDSDIYVFGIPTSVSAYGIALYNSSGALSGDLSRKPLSALARLLFPSGTTSLTIPSVVKPAIIGYPATSHTLSSGGHGGGTPFINTHYEGVWHLQSSTVLERTDVLVDYDRDDGGIPVNTATPSTSAMLIEANGLT